MLTPLRHKLLCVRARERERPCVCVCVCVCVCIGCQKAPCLLLDAIVYIFSHPTRNLRIYYMHTYSTYYIPARTGAWSIHNAVPADSSRRTFRSLSVVSRVMRTSWMCVYKYIYTHVYIHTCVCVYIYVYVYIYALSDCSPSCRRWCAPTRYVHINMQICIHT